MYGAWRLALNTAAIPSTIKFIGITLRLKYVFKTVATKNPKNAPMKRLGAKTPPSPPEANVADVIIGFKINIPINVTIKEIENAVLPEINSAFIAW